MQLQVRRQVVHTFAALKHPNFRLWFLGQLVSLVGTWMQATAQGYLVYQLTASPAYLGYVSFANGIPAWIFTLYSGVVADRMSRRTLLIIVQTSMMVLAFALAGLVFTNLVQPWHIIVLTFLLGIANSFDAPTRLAFVVELVEREDLTNAIAMNSTMFNSAAIVGPVVAGITYAWLGPAWCFTLNGLSFLAVIIALSLMRLAPFVRQPNNNSTLVQIKEGIQYVARHDVIRMMIFNLSVLAMFGMGIVALLPAWAVNILGGDALTNGYLLSARGLGALIGALLVASLGRFRMKGKLWTLGSFATAVFLFVFALIHWLPASLLALVALGWSVMIVLNTSNAIVQSHVEDELRGRVMSIYTLTFFGLMPLGSLLLGIIASQWGEPQAVMFSGFMMLVLALSMWFFRPALRRLE